MTEGAKLLQLKSHNGSKKLPNQMLIIGSLLVGL
jgi:hypothetical protein